MENSYGQFHEIMKKASYVRERVYEKTETINPELKKYWEEYLSSDVMERYVLNANSPFKYTLSTEEFTYVEPENIEELFSIYQDITVENKNSKNMVPSNYFFSPFYNRCVCAGIKFLKRCWKKEFFPLNKAVVDSYCNTLLPLLSEISMRAIIQEMHILKEKGKLFGADPEEEYRYFENSIMTSPSYIVELFNIYPVMCKEIIESVYRITKNYRTLFRRLQDDTNIIISGLLGDKSINNITYMSPAKSDRHRGNQTVFILTFDDNNRIVYKPRSLKAEVCFERMYSLLQEECKLTSLNRTILDRGSYGWEEYIEPSECKNHLEVERFYQRFGLLVALTYVLHTGDLHFENIIAVNEYPVLLDCETLLCNSNQILRQDSALEKIKEQLSDSVLFSGLFPRHTYGDSTKYDVDVSALSGKGGQVFPLKIPRIVDERTSNMHIEYVNPKTKDKDNLPTIDGKPIDVNLYHTFIAKGFDIAYKAIIENKGMLLKVLEDNDNMEIRYLVRNTQQYEMILSLSYHPDFLQNGVDRCLLLCVLFKNMDKDDEIRKQLVDAEQEEILRGEIPYFWYYPKNKELSSEALPLIKGFFTKSNIRSITDKLSSLNVQDKEKQLLYIQLLLSRFTLPAHSEVTKQEICKSPDPKYNSEDFLKAAGLIASDILDKAVYNDEMSEVNWLGITMEGNTNGIWTFEPLGDYLYDGLAGILIFMCALLKKNSKNQRAKRLFDILDQYFRSYSEKMYTGEIKPQTLANGAFFGEASIMYMYQVLYKITLDITYLSYAKKHFSIVREMFSVNPNQEVLMGHAGTILVLLNMYQLTGEKEYLDTAIKVGRLLKKSKLKCPVGVGWKFAHEDYPLTGFAHGNAGISLALFKLWHYSGLDEFKILAQQALAYENSRYSKQLNNWLDDRGFNRDSGEKKLNPIAWCHGAAGILLSRMYAYDFVPEGLKTELLNDMNKAAEAIFNAGILQNNCLCHGNCGNFEILAYYVRKYCPDRVKECESYWNFIIGQVLDKNWKCELPTAYENASFMIGVSGIGYAILRHMDNSLPEILSVSL